MPMRRILFATLFFTLIGLNELTAKEKDSGIWIDYSAVKKIGSATFGILGEFYTIDNSSKIDRISLGLKGDYQFLPWLSAGTGNVLINFYRIGYTELADRI